MNEHLHRTHKNTADCVYCGTRSCCPLGKLPTVTRAAIQPLIRKTRFQRDAVLLTEGLLSPTMKIIQLGLVFELRMGREGCSRPMSVAGRGDVLGLTGFFEQPNLVSAVAVTSGRLCEIDIDGLLRESLSFPELRTLLHSEAARFVDKMASWSEAMRVRGAVNQLAYALLLLSETRDNVVIELPTHTALAELLGSTRETVVRSLSMLAKEGSISRLEQRNCLIVKSALLARLRNEPGTPLPASNDSTDLPNPS